MAKKTLIVCGDRGMGRYTVSIIEKYEGSDILPDEIIYKCKIISMEDNQYNYSIDDNVYVEKGTYSHLNLDGGIDPFIK